MPQHIIEDRAVYGPTGASVVKIQGKTQSDGTIIDRSGSTWIVGKRS